MTKGFKASISKTMCLTLCSLVASATLASAGENGVFLGIGGSFGLEAIAKADIKTDTNPQSVINNTTKGFSGGSELILGYKYFFIEKLGIRGYASVDYSIVMLAKTSDTTGVALAYSQMIGKPSGLLDVNINLDLILEAFSGDVFSLGFFAGVAGGFHLWHGGIVDVVKGINTAMASGTPGTIYNKKTPSIFGSVGVNVGMQMGFGERHAVEVLGKIPFLQDEVISYKFSDTAYKPSSNDAKKFIRVTRPYTVGLRYIFTF